MIATLLASTQKEGSLRSLCRVLLMACMLPWMLRTPVSSTVKCRRKSHRIAYIIYAQKKKQRTKNWSLWNSKTDFKKFRQNSITWNILHLVCEIGFKPAIWYSSYSKCHIFLNKISWSNDELCQELSWSQCAITEKNQIEEGGGGVGVGEDMEFSWVLTK